MSTTSRVDPYEDTRAEAVAWLKEHWDPQLSVREWWAVLAESGWGFPTWPTEWFGRDIDPVLAGAVREAFGEVGALGPPTSLGQMLGAPTLLTHGSDEMKQRFLPALARGEEFWCQFFSEPGSGSDLASAQTRAVADGDLFIVNGQKVWTSGAQWADRGMLVARTDPEVPKHRGLTYFIIDVDQPGIEVRPIHQMNDAHGFNEVFFTDAEVAADRVVGEANDGWAVAVTTLAFERFMSGFGASPGRKAGLLDLKAGDVVSGAARGPREGAAYGADMARLTAKVAKARGLDTDAVTRQGLMDLYIQQELSRVAGLRSAAAVRSGRRPSGDGSVRKLARSDIMRTAREVGESILGPYGMLRNEDEELGGGVIQQVALSSPSSSIAGGTDEIQHNIIGERVLGLPKDPQIDREIPFRELKVGTQRTP
jgi:alkylation response protein AidB-like acyl-CoA dehydrogenase